MMEKGVGRGAHGILLVHMRKGRAARLLSRHPGIHTPKADGIGEGLPRGGRTGVSGRNVGDLGVRVH
ncbi:MAG: hypothetical protein Ct9H300mP25_15920 [Acidobacteriota bacterium]|nr:MAG: hypothetical protein Ct9H300mP25_15920 [Acidobacteriota bacterium]